MQPNRSFILNYYLRRHINTNGALHSKHYQGKFLHKCMNRDKYNKKKWFNDGPILPPTKMSMHKEKRVVPKQVMQRRMALNKLFMGHITDRITTGEHAEHFVERGIEILHTQISLDFQIINIHWTETKSLDNKYDVSNTEFLTAYGFKLRHELSQLRVTSIVPPIQFVKDKTLACLQFLEEQFEKMDFKEDEPALEANNETRELFALKTDTKSTNEIDKAETNQMLKVYPVDPPDMKHDVFGLNRHHIMAKIVAALPNCNRHAVNLTKSTSSQIPVEKIVSESNSNLVENYITPEEQHRLFKDFLANRRRSMAYKLSKRKLKRIVETSLDSSEQDVTSNAYYDDENFDNDSTNYYNHETVSLPYDNDFDKH